MGHSTFLKLYRRADIDSFMQWQGILVVLVTLTALGIGDGGQ
jgi:hypothetical protein